MTDGSTDELPVTAGGDTEEHDVIVAAPRRRWVKRVVLGVLAVVALTAVYYATNLWLVHRTGNSDQARPVDAIVVMGAAQYDGTPSPQLAARLDHVVDLWEQGLAPTVITSGGNQPGDRFTEAEASANYLVDRGVPADAIQEVGGTTSYDSLRLARDLLWSQGAQSVLLVSDPFHSLRIRLVAQELGLTAYVSPTRTSPVQGAGRLWHEVKEAAGISVGRIIGFDRLLRITG
ncbi:MAG: YdcF family protein [Actinobacteria bacterium]|nr:YdcF family protein [Actinomycetota bacterium]